MGDERKALIEQIERGYDLRITLPPADTMGPPVVLPLSKKAVLAALRSQPAADEMSASEALYGFGGWLTGRHASVTFSARDNAAPAAELVAEFCKTNHL